MGSMSSTPTTSMDVTNTEMSPTEMAVSNHRSVPHCSALASIKLLSVCSEVKATPSRMKILYVFTWLISPCKGL